MTKIFSINPASKSVEDVELGGNTQGDLYGNFPYRDGEALTLESNDASTCITTNPFGRVDGSGLKDGVCWLNHPKLGWMALYGISYVFRGTEDELQEGQDKHDLEIGTPAISKENLLKLISWDAPEGKEMPAMANIPYYEVRKMARDWLYFEFGPAAKILTMMS